jgi:hypothetical protein
MAYTGVGGFVEVNSNQSLSMMPEAGWTAVRRFTASSGGLIFPMSEIGLVAAPGFPSIAVDPSNSN